MNTNYLLIITQITNWVRLFYLYSYSNLNTTACHELGTVKYNADKCWSEKKQYGGFLILTDWRTLGCCNIFIGRTVSGSAELNGLVHVHCTCVQAQCVCLQLIGTIQTVTSLCKSIKVWRHVWCCNAQHRRQMFICQSGSVTGLVVVHHRKSLFAHISGSKQNKHTLCVPAQVWKLRFLQWAIEVLQCTWREHFF